MPVIKSAKKKLRKDKKLTVQNQKVKDGLKMLIKAARKNLTEETVRTVQQAVDKAVKKHLIHKNKAARIKSVFAKQIGKKEVTADTAKTSVKTKRSTPKKK